MNRSTLGIILLALSVTACARDHRGAAPTAPAATPACEAPATAVDGYVAAWNTAERELRRCLLSWVWSPSGRYVDPSVDVTGVDALVDHIGGYLQRFPGTRIERVGDLVSHHDVIRFRWRIAAGATTVLDGMDVGRFDAAGRLVHVAGFFEPPPAGATGR